MTSKIVKKTLEEAQGVPNAEIDFSDKSLVHMDDMTRLWWVSSTLFSILVDLHFNIMLCPFTGPKMFCAGPNFFCVGSKIYLHIVPLKNISC